MDSSMADIILMAHALYIGFVVLGWILIVVGMFRNWSWVRNFWLRVMHVLAIGVVIAEAWLGQDCPLTIWENNLRIAAGGATYSDSFIQHWLQKIIFYDFPPWVFILAYTLFGGFVLLTWLVVPPTWPRGKRYTAP